MDENLLGRFSCDVMYMEELINHIKEKAEKGMSIDDAIVELKNRGLTIMESMKILVHAFGVSLVVAKERVASHHVWTDVVQATIPLHEDIVKTLK
jgi:hypothetical protein